MPRAQVLGPLGAARGTSSPRSIEGTSTSEAGYRRLRHRGHSFANFDRAAQDLMDHSGFIAIRLGPSWVSLRLHKPKPGKRKRQRYRRVRHQADRGTADYGNAGSGADASVLDAATRPISGRQHRGRTTSSIYVANPISELTLASTSAIRQPLCSKVAA